MTIASNIFNMLTCVVACLVISCAHGANLENISLKKNIDTEALDTVSKSMSMTNDTLFLGVDTTGHLLSPSNTKVINLNGILIDIYDDGKLQICFNDPVEDANPFDKIMINDKTLFQEIEYRITKTFNPLYGKKLAVIGDSLTCYPSMEKSYPYFIAQRNNMTLVHAGRGGEKLCRDITNSLGQVTNPATINSYTNDIPSDADFILCQVGTNDAADRWTKDKELEPPVDDTDMSLDTFKGCWNNLLLGLKKNYPNARLGIILANNWGNCNIGSNQTEVIRDQTVQEVSQWQKIQCQKLNIPVFDPLEDTKWFVSNFKIYYSTNSLENLNLSWYDRMKLEMGTGQFEKKKTYWISQAQYLYDNLHGSERGNKFLSYWYEQWMKTVLMAQ